MGATTSNSVTVLDENLWCSRRDAHEARVRGWTDSHQARVSRGEKHPVYDFLFSYYAFRPAWLRRWHPGPDVVLTGGRARQFLRWREYHELEPGSGGAPDRTEFESGGTFVALDLA